MKRITMEAVRSVCTKINPSKKEFIFEIFGLDFIIDSILKSVKFIVYLLKGLTN